MKSEEEKKAIKSLSTFANTFDMCVLTMHNCKIILNLINKQQKEIEKKDRQIDLMTDYIAEKSNFCANKCCMNEDCHDNDCIKEYFERKVEGEKK